jgi:hypothetical protein
MISPSFSHCGSFKQKNKEEEMKKKEDRGKKNMNWACNRGCAGEEEKKEKRKERIG